MKQMKKLSALLLALMMALALLTGCGSNGGGDKYASDAATNGAYEEEPAAAPETREPGDYGFADEDMDYEYEESKTEGGESGSSVYDRTDVKLIRRASLEVETTDFDAACAALLALTDKLGGYMEDTQVYQGSYGSTYRSADYTVRVPSKAYKSFLNGVEDSEGFHVTTKNESTEDVGNDYADTESRVKALRTKLDRLNELMEQAESMEDIITIESAITDTEAEIDRCTSKLTRYDRLVSYATISVSIQQVRTISETEEAPFLSRMASAFEEGFHDFVEFLEDFAIWLAGSIFGLALGAVVVVLLVLLLRRISNSGEKRREKRLKKRSVRAEKPKAEETKEAEKK